MTKDRALDLLKQIKDRGIYGSNISENECNYLNELNDCLPHLTTIEVIEKIYKEDIGL